MPAVNATIDLVLWGAAGQAKVLAELIAGTRFRLCALVDIAVDQSPLPGVPILPGEAGLDRWLAARKGQAPLAAGIAIGGIRGGERSALKALLEAKGFSFPALVHRTAFVADSATIGAGCQILAHARVCAEAFLGQAVIVNTGASVDHECAIGDGTHIAPGAILAGEVKVGANAFVGAGAVVLPRVAIGAGAIVGAGAVVTKSVPDDATVVGNPAKILDRQ